jgi:uncharacterized glyoxalase superfamily protein PhnB
MMLMIPKGYEKAKPGTMPDVKAVAAMTAYNNSLQKAGVLMSLEGLHPQSMGARIGFSRGKPSVRQGPFPKIKEALGGFWMIKVKSKEEAIKWASRCPASKNEIIEIRQVQELEEFPEDVQKAAAGFSEMQSQSGKKASVPQTPAPVPEGMNTVTPYLVFTGDCSKALDFYQKALNAKMEWPAEKTPDGKVMHAMVKIGDSNIMLSDTFQNPDNITGLKTNLWLYVDDSDAYYNRAVKEGCEVVMKIEDVFWGDRIGEVKDPFGHTWNFASRKFILTPEEMKKREEEWMKKAGMGVNK